jgi:hypothetical protein
MAVLPTPADRGALVDLVDQLIEHCPDHGCVEPEWGDGCHCEIVPLLRRLAAAGPVSGPGGAADETQAGFQDRGEAARQAAGIDGTAGDAQDVSHTFVLDEPTGGCLLCGLSPTYRKHTPAAVAQPDGEA